MIDEVYELTTGKKPSPLFKKLKYAGMGLAMMGATLATSCYTINEGSKGVVKRFGEYVRTEGSGIHFRLPFNIETYQSVNVEGVQKQEFGFRTVSSGMNPVYIGPRNVGELNIDDNTLASLMGFENVEFDQSLRSMAMRRLESELSMMTGDLNIVDVEFIVQYKISDPEDYLFNVRDPVFTLRDVSLSVMKRIVGNGSVDEAIGMKRIEYEQHAQRELQGILDSYDSGIEVTGVNLQESNPPQRVRDSFSEVNSAMQKKESRINEARREENKRIAEASGKADAQISEARGYAIERVNLAEGDVMRYSQTLEEYAKSPEVTRRRLYFETMEEVLGNVGETRIIEQKGAEGGLLLSLGLNQNKIGESK